MTGVSMGGSGESATGHGLRLGVPSAPGSAILEELRLERPSAMWAALPWRAAFASRCGSPAAARRAILLRLRADFGDRPVLIPKDGARFLGAVAAHDGLPPEDG